MPHNYPTRFQLAHKQSIMDTVTNIFRSPQPTNPPNTSSNRINRDNDPLLPPPTSPLLDAFNRQMVQMSQAFDRLEAKITGNVRSTNTTGPGSQSTSEPVVTPKTEPKVIPPDSPVILSCLTIHIKS